MKIKEIKSEHLKRIHNKGGGGGIDRDTRKPEHLETDEMKQTRKRYRLSQ